MLLPVNQEHAGAENGSSAVGRSSFVGPLEAALRRPLLVLLPLIVLVAAAVAYGLTRSPEYTAESRVNVGRVDVPAFTVQGVVTGNAVLASGYSRIVTAKPVLDHVAAETKVPADDARDMLAGSPVPGSTLIRVESTGDTEAEAIAVANAGAQGLIDYVRELNADESELDRLLAEFRTAQERTNELRVEYADALNAHGRRDPRTLEARLDFMVAVTQSKRVEGQYLQTRDEEAPTDLLQLVAPAAIAESDESSVLQRLIVIAAAAGLAIGFALALLAANRRIIARRES